ncbi:MAG: methyl-accepting chemotaxis protein [Defluviitaleaceae bacterium]|nr:methyl-accepting chemotaxis protein [Defluviitaleaceae bacterium]MCL2836614.1 methyl-accepting chemotaxis protein [Defluviitaleaceae bacterium]
MKLKSKIMVPVLAFLLISTASITILNYNIGKNSVTAMMENIVDSSLQTLINQGNITVRAEAVVIGEINRKNFSLANALAEIVRLNNVSGVDWDDAALFQDIADLLGIAEINVTDALGSIIGSNHADNYGFNYGTADSTRRYMQLLDNPAFQVLEEPRASAVSGDMYQYTGVARLDEKGFVQIGVEANAVREYRDTLDIKYKAETMRVGSTGRASILRDGVIVYSQSQERIGQDASGEQWFRQVSSGRGRAWINVYGDMMYAGYANIDGATMLVLFPETEYLEYLAPVRNMGLIGSAASFIIMLALVYAVMSRVTKPITELSDKIRAVAAGDLNVSLASNAKDEVGGLSRDIMRVVDNFKSIESDLSRFATEINENGDIDYRMDTSAYNGAYRGMAESINGFAAVLIDDVLNLLDALTEISNGNFNITTRQMPGKKAVLTNRIESLTANLNSIQNEIGTLANSASNGILNARADAGKYSGGWSHMLTALNSLVSAVAAPISEIEHELIEMSKGNFQGNITGQYKGEFDKACQAAKSTQKITLSYIKEISEILESIAAGDLTGSIKRDYLGDYAPIKGALETILSSLNKSMSEIEIAAHQVMDGAGQISNSAMSLAEGSTRQASSIEELTASIELINAKIQQNSQNANNANEISQKSAQNAHIGTEAMQAMETSMNGIKQSSDTISHVIKAIESIAFQTNLLALNASVEAAHAGEQGKGFAVVADEVRNLAAKSQQSARETAEMIGNSNNRVNEGIAAAQRTAESHGTIVGDVRHVSELISQIAQMSAEQAESIDQITVGITEISNVVQSNSATSQECASTSQELNSQATMLMQLVSYFKLKK